MKVHFKYTLFIFLFGLLTSCSSQKELSGSKQSQEMPAWISSRPSAPSYYIGIGVARKSIDPNYIQSAKNSALNDLASEISVNISSNSFLYTMERQSEFQEEYQSNIKSTINQNISGYEIVDSYENDREYWVFYRLSKAKYEEDKRIKKQTALDKSFNFYSGGRDLEEKDDIIGATNAYLQALVTLKDYWSDLNEVAYNGTTIQIDNDIYSRLHKMYGFVEIEPEHPRIFLDFKRGFESQLKIKVTYKGKNISRFPLIMVYPGEFGKIKQENLTNTDGETVFLLNKINTSNARSSVKINANLHELPGLDKSDKMTESIISSLKTVEQVIPVELVYPLVYVSSSEKNFGNNLSTHKLSEQLKSGLTKSGFSITENIKEAQLLFNLKADTRSGDGSGKFKVAYLDMYIEVKNPETNKIILKESQTDIKGIQLTMDKAGMECYRKLADNFDRKVIPIILKGLKN